MRRGYCEVHPDIPESYPCSECTSREEEPYPEQERDYYDGMERHYYAMVEQYWWDREQSMPHNISRPSLPEMGE